MFRLLSMLGRSREPGTTPFSGPSAVTIAEMKKSSSIADARYEKTGPHAERVQMYVRRSRSNKDLYTFENSLGEQLFGSREEIALKLVRRRTTGGLEIPVRINPAGAAKSRAVTTVGLTRSNMYSRAASPPHCAGPASKCLAATAQATSRAETSSLAQWPGGRP